MGHRGYRDGRRLQGHCGNSLTSCVAPLNAGLMTSVVGIFLLAIQAERADHREVIEIEQTGILRSGPVRMLVPGPRGHAEDVALLPVEPLPVHDREALTLGHLIDRTARVTVG